MKTATSGRRNSALLTATVTRGARVSGLLNKAAAYAGYDYNARA